MELFLYADLVFNNVETLHLCCDIGRGDWLGRVLKIMGNVSLAIMTLRTCAMILEGAMENH